MLRNLPGLTKWRPLPVCCLLLATLCPLPAATHFSFTFARLAAAVAARIGERSALPVAEFAACLVEVGGQMMGSMYLLPGLAGIAN